jgi:hypothetical protein
MFLLTVLFFTHRAKQSQAKKRKAKETTPATTTTESVEQPPQPPTQPPVVQPAECPSRNMVSKIIDAKKKMLLKAQKEAAGWCRTPDYPEHVYPEACHKQATSIFC